MTTKDLRRHVEDGGCWCDEYLLREVALDAWYPDRCQIPGDPGNPNAGVRTCIREAAHRAPCYGGLERPSEPCHFCGEPTDPGGANCSACWVDLTTMPLADVKALFAAGAPDLSIDPVTGPIDGGRG